MSRQQNSEQFPPSITTPSSLSAQTQKRKDEKKISAAGYLLAGFKCERGIPFENMKSQEKEAFVINPQRAFACYKKAKELGSWDGVYHLGRCYAGGIGVEKNIEQAVQLWQAAAEKGDARAMGQLAACYKFGYGVKRESAKSKELYSKSFALHLRNANHEKTSRVKAEAQWWLFQMYCIGLHVDANPAEARQYCKLAAENGNLHASLDFGKFYLESENPEEAFKYYHAMFKKEKDPRFQEAIGFCYLNGIGVEQSFSKAANIFYKTANVGLPESQYTLGCMHAQGCDVTLSLALAQEWCKKAAAQGHSEAAEKLKELGPPQVVKVVRAKRKKNELKSETNNESSSESSSSNNVALSQQKAHKSEARKEMASSFSSDTLLPRSSSGFFSKFDSPVFGDTQSEAGQGCEGDEDGWLCRENGRITPEPSNS